jgi:signal transduction histidine kinase
MGLSAQKPRKIPLLFILGIGIPCLLLGYLAFRGIQNDQALLEKERLNKHREILDLVTMSVEENILNAELAALKLIVEHKESDQFVLVRSVDSLKNRIPLIEELFFSDNSGNIQLPYARLLFLPDGSTQSLSTVSEPVSSARSIGSGQRMEFQEKDYQKALASYRQDFEQVSDPRTKAELLNSIGRVQKKSKLFQDAVRTYETIFRDYNHMHTTGGVPLGLAARSKISALYMTIYDTAAALETFSNLYKDLLNGEWILEKAQYDFYSQHIKETVDDIFSKAQLPAAIQSYKNDFSFLYEEKNEQTRITERLLTFQENATKDLKLKFPLNTEEPRKPAIRFSMESGQHEYLVSLLGQFSVNENRGNEIFGIVLNADYLRDSLLCQALQSYVNSGETGWIVKGMNDQSILQSEDSPSGSITVRTNFEEGFPPWFVALYQQETDLFETFLTSKRGIYFYMFILLAGILIFGLILTVRTFVREIELSRMKSDFVSTISHEFKSPLSSIRQLSEMLQSGRIPAEEYRQQYYDVLVEQSERLSLLIDNILDFSKIEEGKKEFDFEMVEIGSLLQEIVTAIQDQVRHKDFNIQLEIEAFLPLVKADRAAISQAITNLIDNAIKYSGEARNIIVRTFAKLPYLMIVIKDFGIGIRKEEIEKVFERFYRGGDELTRTIKGSGLGLTLVKQIVEVHNGNIDVESKPGKGSTFSIQLPVQQPTGK